MGTCVFPYVLDVALESVRDFLTLSSMTNEFLLKSKEEK